MDDARFDELIGPLVETAYARGLPDAAIQDAAVAAWRRFPRLKTGEAAAAFFERKLGKASPAPGAAEGVEELAAETLADARAHSRRAAALVHAPLVAAGLAVLVAVVALGPHALAASQKRPHLPATGGTRTLVSAPWRVSMPPRPEVPIPYVGRAPAGEPLLWTLDDFSVPSRLLAFDMQGRPVGSLPGPRMFTPGGLRASPSGDVLWLGDHFVDRWGRTLAKPAWGYPSFIWSDRSDEVCGLSDGGALWTYRFGSAVQIRHRFAAMRLSLVGCSANSDLALLTKPGWLGPGTPPAIADGPQPIRQALLVRLSDGAIVHSWSYKEALSSVLASADLSLIAEVPYFWAYGAGGDLVPGYRAPDSVVRRTADGAVVQRIAGAVRSLSTDGSLAGVGSADGASENEVDVATGQTVGVGSLPGGSFLAAPAPGMLLAVTATNSRNDWLRNQMYLVDRGGETSLQVGYSVTPLDWVAVQVIP